jgi:hypothetical protein
MRVAFLVCAVLFLIGTAQAEVAHHPFQLFSKPSDDSCSGTQNTHPIITEDPTFIKKVENGSLYQIASMDPPLNIVHLYGTPYEMGYAQGELLADQMESLMGDFFAYIELVIQPYISFLPEEMQELLATKGVEALLE